MELVASFVNRSNFLKYWEKTDIYEVSTSGVHGPKNTAITRIPVHALPRSSTHCSHRTALVCSGCHTPWLMRGASARQKTRNQFIGRVVRQSLASQSGRTPCPKAATQEVSLHDETT